MSSSLSSRRTFLRHTMLGTLAVCTGPRLRAAAHGLTIGLSQYSLKGLFTAKTLDPLDYPAFARREFGITELDLWEGGLPADRLDDDRYLAELRKRAADAGTHLFLLMAGVVDATGGAGKAKKKAKPADHARSIERSAQLGCQYVRFFVSAPEGDRAAAVARCTEALAPLAEVAKARGITIAIEPGASTHTQDGAFLAAVATRLGHSHCRLMPDFGKLRGDIYAGTEAMMPHAAVISAKTHEFDDAGNQVEFDYFRLMKIVAAAGFRGIVAIEWEGKKLDPVAGVHASKKLIERALAAV
ncbi:MAG: sugar phosphate isomerase/epimerase [Verrucomicrobia bacterium]|nr:sugar phosphate isomerase/epimerase [Verrucomicrobiota bacterium]